MSGFRLLPKKFVPPNCGLISALPKAAFVRATSKSFIQIQIKLPPLLLGSRTWEGNADNLEIGRIVRRGEESEHCICRIVQSKFPGSPQNRTLGYQATGKDDANDFSVRE